MNELVMHHYHHGSGQIDSLTLEIGTPGKGGAIKVRGDADDPVAFMRRVKTAYAMRAYAQEFENGNLPPPSYVQAAQEGRAGKDRQPAPPAAGPEGEDHPLLSGSVPEVLNTADRQRKDLTDMEEF